MAVIDSRVDVTSAEFAANRDHFTQLLDDLREREKVVEAVFAGPANSANFAADPRVRRVESSGRTLRLFVHADHAGVMRAVEALQPKTLDLRDQNLEQIFYSAVEESRRAMPEDD